jgi:hypothetical protein
MPRGQSIAGSCAAVSLISCFFYYNVLLQAGHTAAYYAEPLELKQMVTTVESPAQLTSKSAGSTQLGQAGPVPKASAAELCSSVTGDASMANSSSATTSLPAKIQKVADQAHCHKSPLPADC